jgi:hypothetical protein
MATEGRPRFEVADVVRAHAVDYLRVHTPSAAQERVLKHIRRCRTAALGGHREKCDSCGHQRISYNSCRDRHCPKCQGKARARWITERLERLLPVPYFHAVFTLPHQLNPLALRNKRAVFNLLFAAASQSLLTMAGSDKYLGAEIGFTAVLHTWGRNLLFHPHLHCVVTGGGLSTDGTRWIPTNGKYLLPVKALGRLFRGKFLAALDLAYRNGELDLAGSSAELQAPPAWRRFKDHLYEKDWVVYAKPPFGGPEQVFKYLGHYSHRIAVSNRRIIDFSDGKVTFSWKDYAHGCRKKLLTLDAVEFLRRFLLHVLPPGFVRIRHFGLCAGANVNGKLETARRLAQPTVEAPIPKGPDPASDPLPPWWERYSEKTGIDLTACPSCGAGRMVRLHILPSFTTVTVAALIPVAQLDTS